MYGCVCMCVHVCTYIHLYGGQRLILCLLNHSQLYSFGYNIFQWTWSSSIDLGCWPVSSRDLPISVLSAGTTGAWCCLTFSVHAENLNSGCIAITLLTEPSPKSQWTSGEDSECPQVNGLRNDERLLILNTGLRLWKRLTTLPTGGGEWETAAQKANLWHTYSLCWDPSQGPL